MIKSNEQLTVNVMDRNMSTSITLLDRNFNANDVDIMVFEPCVLFPPCGGFKTWPKNLIPSTETG